jgi:hypothetical protein
MTKYKITHPESDCDWIEEDPSEERLTELFNYGLTIQEIEE